MRARKHQGKRGRVAAIRRGFDLRRSLVTLAALVAILAQTFIVQTHVDFAGVAPAAASAQATSGAAPIRAEVGQAPADDTSPCVICQTLATAGAAIMASATAPIAAATDIPPNAPIQIDWVGVRPAYSWQSRAPPTRL